MEIENKIARSVMAEINIKTGAKVSLIILLLYVIRQLVFVYQTKYQLTNPLIPKSTISEINKQFIFTALISSVISIFGLMLYVHKKYLLVIVLVVITLIADRFIYI